MKIKTGRKYTLAGYYRIAYSGQLDSRVPQRCKVVKKGTIDVLVELKDGSRLWVSPSELSKL